MTDSQTQANVEALAGLLRHYDPPQLLFQLAEIAGERTYLKHGLDVHEGDIALDAGANVGVATAFFASEWKAGLVHSFEPVAPLFELLRDDVRHWDACVPHKYGLAVEAGTAPITGEEDRIATIFTSLTRHGFSVNTDQESMWRNTGIHMLYAKRQ